MERLTIKLSAETEYTLKIMCHFDKAGELESLDSCCMHCECRGPCGTCGVQGIQEAFNRLAAYEDTEISPEEVKTLQEDNARLHKLLDNLEAVLTRKPPEHNSGNDNKVHCKDCDYLNMDSGKPFCCHPRMSTNGLDDWCNFGTKRQS